MAKTVKVKDGVLTYTGRNNLTLEEPGVPNLDAQTEDWLMSFWHATYIGGWAVARFLFPERPARYVTVTGKLGNYASNKATAQRERLAGNIESALYYERIADSIYEDLPDYARW